MGWGSFLKSTLRLGGRMTSATAHTVGSAVLHPQQTLKGVGSATKSAVVGGSLGYIGWEKLTTDKSVVGIVSDAVIGEDTTKKIGDTVSGIGEGNVSGLSLVGLVVSALLVFGRFGWLGKIAGAVLGMMMIGNNANLSSLLGGTSDRKASNHKEEEKQQEVEQTNTVSRRR